MPVSTTAPAEGQLSPAFVERRRTADRIFRAALIFNSALTLFWVVMLATHGSTPFFATYDVTREGLIRVFTGILFFNVIWGFIWYGVKTALLASWAKFSKEERRQRVLLAHAPPVRRRRARQPPFGAAHSHRRHDRPPRPLHHARLGRLLLPLLDARRPQSVAEVRDDVPAGHTCSTPSSPAGSSSASTIRTGSWPRPSTARSRA